MLSQETHRNLSSSDFLVSFGSVCRADSPRLVTEGTELNGGHGEKRLVVEKNGTARRVVEIFFGCMTLSHAEMEGLSGAVIGMAIEIHKDLGPGLLESNYEECMCIE